MKKLGYLQDFREMVDNEKKTISGDNRKGEVTRLIIEILCESDLMTYEGIAILEKCAFEVISGSKIKQKKQI